MMYELRYRQCREQGKTGWFDGQTLEDLLARLAERMQAEYLPKRGRVLELGCGAGDQSLQLARAGYEVAGVDTAPTSIAWANEKAKQSGLNAHYRVGDVCDLNGFDTSAFDLVLDGNCLHFVIGEKRRRMLESAYRVLKPGGWLLITSICCEPSEIISMPDYDPVTHCFIQDGVAYTYMGLAADIREEIMAAGFEIGWQEVTPAIPDVQAAFLRVDAKKNTRIPEIENPWLGGVPPAVFQTERLAGQRIRV